MRAMRAALYCSNALLSLQLPVHVLQVTVIKAVFFMVLADMQERYPITWWDGLISALSSPRYPYALALPRCL